MAIVDEFSDVNELKCKIIIVGDSDVGKTTLMNKFCRGTFNGVHNATVGVSYDSKRIHIFDKIVNMMIWDTAGQEKYFALTKSFFRHAMGVLFVYDVTRPNTLFNMTKWFDVVQQEAPPDMIKILVGHKCDDEDSKQISLEEGQTVADHFGMLFFEASAKENINVNSIFNTIGTSIVEMHWSEFFPPPSDVIVLTNEQNNPEDVSNCFVCKVYNWFSN